MGNDRRKNNQDEVGHKKKQAGKNTDNDIERLTKKQMPRRKLEYLAIRGFKRFEKKAADDRQHQEVNRFKRSIGIRINHM